MRKSAITFGLLASSLVMLTAMPLFNNNNFLNAALAQGYYDDSYSTYPTDDKKYECRTGPFEGFFVGSVEFCKFNKFDKDDRKDIRDNRTGTQGPPGPPGPPGLNGTQGPPGATGATGATGSQGLPGTPGSSGDRGPAGPNQINSTGIYTVRGPSVFIQTAGLNQGSSIAECLPGDTVLSGSFEMQNGNTIPFRIVDRALSTQDGWNTTITAAGGSSSGSSTLFWTYAQCFNNP